VPGLSTVGIMPASNIMPFEEGLRFLATGASCPTSLVLRTESPLIGWEVIENSRDGFEQQLGDAGWKFFFVAGAIKATAHGFSEKKTLAEGMRRLAVTARGLKCNSFEVDRVTHGVCLGVSRVTISGHARHLQKGTVMFGD
jgi:hypothetical protein